MEAAKKLAKIWGKTILAWLYWSFHVLCIFIVIWILSRLVGVAQNTSKTYENFSSSFAESAAEVAITFKTLRTMVLEGKFQVPQLSSSNAT
jgi:flagellar biosynthesis/type III secretory pathway M-ring protein FliF/YscJ